MFDFIFGKSIKLDHDFFGEMHFIGNKKDRNKGFFECSRYFRPSGKSIEIGIDAAVAGPTQVQVAFFKSIEEHYSEITNSIQPLIEDEFGNWQEGFKVGEFNKEFDPIYLRIPRCEAKPIIWEIAFETDHDRNHTVTLTMTGFIAKEILIDG